MSLGRRLMSKPYIITPHVGKPTDEPQGQRPAFVLKATPEVDLTTTRIKSRPAKMVKVRKFKE